MDGEYTGTNYNLAKAEADKVVVCTGILSVHELAPPYSRTLWSFNHFNPDFM